MNNNFNFHIAKSARAVFFAVFSSLFVLKLFYISFIDPFELVSDTQAYYNAYQRGDVFVFGVEFFVPFLFCIFDALGFEFYTFVFMLGLFHLYVIVKLAGKVSLLLLPFYFLFFYLYFSPGYFFLLRQYFAFSLFLLFLMSNNRWSCLFLFLAVFSHLSAILFVFFMLLKVNKKFGLLVVFLLLLSLLGFSFLDFFISLLEKVSVLLNQSDLNRKVRGMLVHAESSKSSGVILLILCVSLLIHAFLLTKAVNTRLLSLFFYSSCAVLMFQDSVVIANRIGFAAYFFSLIYLIFVIDSLRITRSFKLRVIGSG